MSLCTRCILRNTHLNFHEIHFNLILARSFSFLFFFFFFFFSFCFNWNEHLSLPVECVVFFIFFYFFFIVFRCSCLCRLLVCLFVCHHYVAPKYHVFAFLKWLAKKKKKELKFMGFSFASVIIVFNCNSETAIYSVPHSYTIMILLSDKLSNNFPQKLIFFVFLLIWKIWNFFLVFWTNLCETPQYIIGTRSCLLWG